MFQSKRPNATIPFMEAESKTRNKRGQPENPFLPHTILSPRVLLIVNRVCVCLSVSIKNSVLLYLRIIYLCGLISVVGGRKVRRT